MFSQSPIRGTPEISLDESFITRRSRRPRRRSDSSIDLDALNDTIMRSPQDMDIANSDISFLNESMQHIDLDTPPRRRRRVSSNATSDMSPSMGNMSSISNDSERLITQEEIDAENERQLALLQENAKFDIDIFDPEEEHIVLPEVSMAITPTSISVYDFINIQEMSLKQFLEEDPDNIAFKYHTQKLWMGIDRASLAQSVMNPSQIKYECLKLNTEGKVNLSDVNRHDAYYNLRGIGFPSGVLPAHDIGAILRDNRRLYELVPTEKVLLSTISFGYIHYRFPASDVCTPGNEAVVYTARAIRNTETSGGKKKKQRKTQKKKLRKTQKKQKKSKKTHHK